MGTYLARELHDSVVQTLAAMLIDLENFRLDQHGRDTALKQIDQLEQATRKALSDLRELLAEVRRQHRGEEDLVGLIRRAMLEQKSRTGSTEFALLVAANWPELIPASTARELYSIAMESVNNAVRHGHASKIEVALGIGPEDGVATMTIRDDGSGITNEAAAGHQSGFGILAMRERASLLGGQLSLATGPPGKGTTVRIVVPSSVLGAARTSG